MKIREENPTSAPHSGDLASYVEALDTGLPIEPFDHRPLARVTRELSPVERATCRIRIAYDYTPRAIGPVQEAAARLFTLHRRGLLAGLSGQTVARTLATALGPTAPNSGHPRSLVHANYGWALLAAMDASWIVEVTVGTPDPADPRRYKRMRLHQRLILGNADVHIGKNDRRAARNVPEVNLI